MDLIQLRMFCQIAETGSMAKAAELMQRVPSNLTTRIHQLEEELGTDLLIREKQRLRLSPMGHMFLGYAQRILALSDEAISLTHSGTPAGVFTLGAMESAAATVLPELLVRYHEHYPEVDVQLTVASADEIIEQLRTGVLAAALIDNPLHHQDIHGCVAFRDKLVLISPIGHTDVHHATDAKDEILYTFKASLSDQLRIDNWFRKSDCAPARITELMSYHTMLTSVASGAGLGILPYKVLTQLPAQSLVKMHPLPDDIASNTTWLMWRHETFNANIRAFKELIIQRTVSAESEQAASF